MKPKGNWKAVCLTLLVLCGFLMTGINTSAEYESEAPTRIDRNDGGNTLANGAKVTFYYQFIRKSVDEIHGTATYQLGEYFDIVNNTAPIYSDYVYLTNRNVTKKYIGVFNKHNGDSLSPGTYTRDVWLTMTLVSGKNTIIMKGDDEGIGGDASIVVNLGKIGHDPVVHGIDGTWIQDDVSSGLRTWESVYTDGATGNAQTNQLATSTGFFFSDEDEQKTKVGAYASVPVAQNSSIKEMQKQNADGSWSVFTDFNELNNVGLYRIKACTTDQAGYTACGSRYINVVPRTFTVTFKDSNGTVLKTQTVNKGSSATAPSNPTKTGYHFTGWDKSYTNVTSNITVTAQYAPNTYTVKYNGNGATSGTTANSTHTYDTAKNLNRNGYVRTGWKFIKWNSKADGTGTDYSNQQSVKNLTSTNNGTVNLYAIWDQAPTITAGNKAYYENEISAYDWMSKYRMQGVSANDRENGNLTSKVIVKTDNVDVSKPGSYQVIYEVTDQVGQTTQKAVTITINYNNPPVISAPDRSYYENEITEEQWQSIRKQKVTASDKEDGTLTNQIEIIKDNVNVKVAGSYEVIYRVTDQYGKTTTKASKVIIQYNHSPEISGNDRWYWLGDITQTDWLKVLRMSDVTAVDKEDGDLTQNVKVKLDEVDVSDAGVYRVIYEVADRFGKIAEKLINVEIRHNDLPIITANNITFHEGEYTADTLRELLKENAKANDPEDGDLSAKVKIIQNNVNPDKAGTYTVIYEVTDSFGNTVVKIVDVTVFENREPILQLFAPDKRFIEGEYTQEEWIERLRYTDVTAYDQEDHDLTSKLEVIKDTTKTKRAGIYAITYQVKDQWGKAKTVTAKVTVEPNKAPVIYASDKYYKASEVITEKDLLKSVYGSDDHDGDVSKQIKIAHHTVISGKTGIYEVTYEVQDRFGKIGTKTIQVHIEPSIISPRPPIQPIDPEALFLWNGRSLGKVSLTKLMEESEITMNPDAYKDVVFGVYSAEDIITDGEVVLPANKLIGISGVDENGNMDIMVYHAGKYYVKELCTDDHYLLDSNPYYFYFIYEDK